jgi:hypothetical protein
VNRCLGPYSDEGLAVLLDGAAIQDVDKVSSLRSIVDFFFFFFFFLLCQ